VGGPGKRIARRLAGWRAISRDVPGSELGRQVAVDFESDADFHECGSCPVHSGLLTFHVQQLKLHEGKSGLPAPTGLAPLVLMDCQAASNAPRRMSTAPGSKITSSWRNSRTSPLEGCSGQIALFTVASAIRACTTNFADHHGRPRARSSARARGTPSERTRGLGAQELLARLSPRAGVFLFAKLLAPAAHDASGRLDAALLSTGRLGRVRYRSPSKCTAGGVLMQSNSHVLPVQRSSRMDP
jgi:hypothetical protein